MRFSTNRITQQKGFTAFELFVVLSVITVLMVIAASIMAKRNSKVATIKCSNHLKQIALAFKVYAGDHNGKFPWIPKSSGTDFTNQHQVWQYFQIISNELGPTKFLLCPRDKQALKNPAQDFSSSKDGLAHPSKQNHSISYFLGIYSSDSMVNSILAGDRTLTAPNMSKLYTSNGTNAVEVTTDSIFSSAPLEANHEGGNYAFADGSIQQTRDSSLLQGSLELARDSYGTNANRFLFPQ